jgi:hypothetical protein
MPPVARGAVVGAHATLLIFSLGFILGTFRVVVVAPALGPWLALLLEVPVMLLASFLVFRRLIGTARLPVGAPRLICALTAFACLIAAEFLLETLVFAESPASFIGKLSSAIGLAGLLGQMGFVIMPLLVRRDIRGPVL